MFGQCKKTGCTKPAIGSYYGGSPGLCSQHFGEQEANDRQEVEEAEQKRTLEKARRVAEKYKITLAEAILLIK